ncbi:MAG: phosphatase PAP2 family protein [Gemmatimonadaceae bacterium]
MAGFASIKRRTLCLALALSSLIVPSFSAAHAQVTTGEDGRTVVPRDTAKPAAHRTLFTYRDAALAAAFAGLTVAMLPVDRHIAESLQDEDLQANKFFDRSGRGVEWISTPGSFIIGGGLYAIGKIGGYKDLADLGWHGTEAVLLASTVTSVLKGTLGRSRPYVNGDTIPGDFHFGWGFGGGNYKPGYSSKDYVSFPSGHTTTAFAAASVVTSEARRIWPKSVPYVATAMYGGATLVGLSRMYHNNHWASDVVLGAAVGTFSGLKVVRYSHAHPDNKLDKFILGATLLPTPNGATLSLTLPAP